MSTLRAAAVLVASLSFACTSPEICSADELDCFLDHLEVRVDGQAVQLEEVLASDLTALTQPGPSPGTEPSIAFAVGNGVILELRSDGGIQELDAGVALESVWAAADTDVWAVGGTTRLHFDGERWTAASPSPVPVHAVWGSGPQDVWFVGDQGTVLRFDGAGTQALSSGTTATLTAVSGSGPDDVWIGGDGVILRYDGSEMTTLTTGLAISGVYVDASGTAALATATGLYVWPKDEASLRRVPTSYGYSAIHGASTYAKVVSPQGAWTHYEMGGTTAASTLLGPWDLRGVWTDGSYTWIVGANGLVAWAPPGTGVRELRVSGPDLLAVSGAKVTSEPSKPPLIPPAILNVPDPITIDTRTGEFATITPGIELQDTSAACRPPVCLYLCGGDTQRCVMGGRRCIPGLKDGLQRLILPLAVRYAGVDPAFENEKQILRVVPVLCAGTAGPICDSVKSAVAAGATCTPGQEISIDVTVLGDPIEDPGGGGIGGGGGGNTCEPCVSGQPCAACGGTIACGNACCGQGETCTSSGCKNASGTGGFTAVSVAPCGVNPRYTVQCAAGGCCPTCMTCDPGGNLCNLP